jgi:hypothetical protein
MKIKEGHKMMRVPAPAGKKNEGTAIVDSDNKIVAYSANIISMKDENPQWDFVRVDMKR